MTAEDLLNTLKHLVDPEFDEFKWFLKQPGLLEGCRSISAADLQTANRWTTIDLMVKAYNTDGALKVTMKVLKKIPRNDLLQSLSDTSSGPQVMVERKRLPGAAGSSADSGASSSQTEGEAPSSNISPPRVQDLSNNQPVDQLGHQLDSLRVKPAEDQRLRPGLRRYSCELTVDTNTVNRNIKLSDNNRKLRHVEELQSYPDHPDRFERRCPQLLCRTGLTGRCYWEVKWSGTVHISVSYRRISRRHAEDSQFGLNNQSWSLNCTNGAYSVWHNYRLTPITSTSPSGRVSVYLDWSAGSLSFYRVSSDSLIHLHTFNTTFTEPLYPGFGLMWPGSSVSLC